MKSPSNPLLTVADLEAVCAAPRKPGAIVAVDNTFATPLNQQPLELGATVSLQSATKFIGGHSDLLAGVAMVRDDALWQALKKSRELTGATPGTLEAFLAVRGVRTLALRLERAQQTAILLAEWLEEHPMVSLVRYPGLPSHPTHNTARHVLKGFGTIISFDLKGGAEVADEVCQNIRHATSLGAVESTKSDEPRSLDRGTCHHRSFDSVLVSRTRTIFGLISTRQYALLHYDSVDFELRQDLDKGGLYWLRIKIVLIY